MHRLRQTVINRFSSHRVLPRQSRFFVVANRVSADSIISVMQAELAIQEYLEYVIAQLIKHPEDAGVLHSERGDRHIYKIRLHPEDAGRVIGRNGKTIGAVRSLAIAAAQKCQIRVDIELESED